MKPFYSYLFLSAVVVNFLLSGGRIASSDELSFFLTTESLVERGELSINPDLVTNGRFGRDGKFYSGVGIGQPALSIPLYLLGKGVVGILRIPEPLGTLALRSVVSLLNQIYAGLIAALMFAFGIKLGYSKRLSLFLTLALLFTTNLFPYFKSFMREPQLLFYLLAAAYFLFCYKQVTKSRYILYAGILSGVALLTRLTSAMTLPVLFAYLVFLLYRADRDSERRSSRILKGVIIFAAPIVVAMGVNAYLNYIQFGGITAMPYAEAQFTTPLFVGLYGLLFSSGKSYFLYAPLAVLAVVSIPAFAKKNKAEFYLFAALFLVHLLFFAKFVAWAGDGSWGPRYLISTLPFLILPIGSLLQQSRIWKRMALGLAAVGFLIQIGGVSIYLGNYLREIGEYPYTKDFHDPEFLYKSHYIPNYSPVVGHWRMLVRNIKVNFSDERPSFTVMRTEERIPLSDGEQKNLLYTLDFWFMYASYAGIKTGIIASIAVLLGLLSLMFGYKTYRLLLVFSESIKTHPKSLS